MDKKDSFKDTLLFFLILIYVLGTFVAIVVLKVQSNDLKADIQILQKTVDLQDQDIIQLNQKIAQLKDEISSLEIFDCTFGKFPELRDQLFNDIIEGEFNEKPGQ